MSVDSTLGIFKKSLREKWTVEPTCEVHPKEIKCRCRRKFVRVKQIVRWMKLKSDDTSECNAELLLNIIQPIRSNFFERESQQNIYKGDSCALLVLACLIKLGYESLIGIFWEAGITDNNISSCRVQYGELEHKLRTLASYDGAAAGAVCRTFEEEKWAFCPKEIHENLDSKEEIPDDAIMPFCFWRRVNQGGTATVFEVAVQEEFLSPGIRKQLGNPFQLKAPSSFDLDYGACYSFAIKSYPISRRKDFDYEKWAFLGLKHTPGVVQCFGTYRHVDGSVNKVNKTCNFLLEYGQTVDLDGYFRKAVPPHRPKDIIQKWEEICEVATAIQQLHRNRHEKGHYHGWHGDIKPGNLLLVNNEWKLADFGYTEFELIPRDSEALLDNPDTNTMQERRKVLKLMRGGTKTFGPPEYDRIEAKSQSIDSWSFGCVLSMAATWMVRGSDGISDFAAHRYLACKKRRLADISDVFHDGNDVLPDVKDWHRHLNEVMRKSDYVTSKILELVDRKLLIKIPEDRLSFSDICLELKDIFQTAKRDLTEPDEFDHVETSLQMAEEQRQEDELRESLNGNISEVQPRVYSVRDPNSNSKGAMVQVLSKPRGSCSDHPEETGLLKRSNLSLAQRRYTITRPSGRVKNLKMSTPMQNTVNESISSPELCEEPDQITIKQNKEQTSQELGVVSRPVERMPSYKSAPTPRTQSDKAIPISKINRSVSRRPVAPSSLDYRQPALQSAPQICDQNDHSSESTHSHSHGSSDLSSPAQPELLGSSSHRSGSFDISYRQLSQSFSYAADVWTAVNERSPNSTIKSAIERFSKADLDAAGTLLNSKFQTPLMVAAHNFNLDMVNVLVSHSDVCQQDDEGNTALHLLILARTFMSDTNSSRFKRALLGLIKHDKTNRLVNMVDNNGRTALWHCVHSRSLKMLETIRILVDKEASINFDDTKTQDVLVCAIEVDMIEFVQYFIDEKGAVVPWEKIKFRVQSADLRKYLKQFQPKDAGAKGKKGFLAMFDR